MRLRLRRRCLSYLRLRRRLPHLRLRLRLSLSHLGLRLSLSHLRLRLRLGPLRYLPHLRLWLTLPLALPELWLRLSLLLWLPHLRLRLSLSPLDLGLNLGLALPELSLLRLPLPHLRLALARPHIVANSRLHSRPRSPRQHRQRRAVRHHRPCRNGHRRPSLILVEELLPVLRRIPLHLNLRLHRRMALLMQHGNLCWPRLHLNAAASAVEADAVHNPVVHHLVVDVNIAGIHVTNHVDIHAIHRRVVAEVVMVPIPAVVSVPGISKPVVDAAIEADVQSPEPVL